MAGQTAILLSASANFIILDNTIHSCIIVLFQKLFKYQVRLQRTYFLAFNLQCQNLISKKFRSNEFQITYNNDCLTACLLI